MSIKSRAGKSTVDVGRELAPALAALERHIKKSTSSAKAATKSLKSAGILDRKGRLHSRYR